LEKNSIGGLMIDLTKLTEEELKYINDRYDSIEEYQKLKLKEYLRSTDYCVIKMYETVIQGGSIIEMLKEYKEVLSKRKEARQLINELEIGEGNGE
jgi:hypothetical protein